MTTKDTIYRVMEALGPAATEDDARCELEEGERVARVVLAGIDKSFDWRLAGYTSARGAASVLVGDGGAPGDVAAVILVAEAIEVQS